MTDRADARPLTGAQAGIWYAQQRDPGSPAYNCAEYVELDGPLDADRFETALRQAVAETAALRLRCGEPDDAPEPVMTVADGDDWPLHRVDTSAHLDPYASAVAWMREDLRQPVDLSTGPLFGHALFSLGGDRHLWYFRAHHIALDGYGFTLVEQRVAELYTAAARGETAPLRFGSLDELRAEEAGYGASARRSRDREHWLALLSGLPEPVTPATAPGNAPPSADCLRSAAPLPDTARAATAEAVRRLGTTAPEFQLAAVAAYLHRATGRPDVVLGLPYAGRLGSAAARVPANTVNVLPLVLDVRPDMTPGQLVRHVAERLRELRRHARYRGEDIRRDLRLPATGRRLTGPLVNVGLTSPDLRFDGIPGTVRPLSAGPVDDLTVSFRDDARDGGTTLHVDANPALHDEEAPAVHHRRLVTFLTAFAASYDDPIGLLAVIADDERAHVPELASRIPDVTGDHPGGPTLCDLFGDQVQAHPDAEAVVAGEERVTYRELNERSNRLAHELLARGVGRDDLVALALPRSVPLVVAVLAVLKAGAGYLPLDPDQPAARTAAVLRSARPALLIGDTTEHDALVPRLDPGDPALDARPATAPATGPVSDGDTAYVIHTSGSTGEPKGVVIPHRNVVRLLTATDHWFGFGPHDTWTLFHSYAFDFSVWELFGALLRGGRLVVVSYTVSREPAAFLRLLADERVTVLNQTPSAFEQLVLADRDDPETSARLTLRHIVLGGEPLRPAVLTDWYRRHPEDAPRVVNMYGITETTVHVTHRPLGGTDALPDATGLIGVPIPDLRVRVLDAALCPVPPGATGEMYIAGPGLARGYLDRPGLTAERFLPDPYGPPGARMYRSGDLARRDADGRLDHLGRADDQVKIRGFRIEPGEVEAALLRHPALDRAAVVARDDESTGRALVAYVVPRADATADPRELRRHAAALLPAHMVPAAVVPVPALPLTVNGKLDRAALPDPGPRGTTAPADGRQPTGAREEVLRGIFADLLGAERVGAHDDFFELGGHSLLATRLVGRVRDALDARIGVRDLFEAPTPAGLAARLDTSAGLRPRLTTAVRPERIPLSYAQRRLWFLHRMEGPSPTYNIPLALRLTGPLDVDALRGALDDLLARHESLRTVFPPDGDEPYQHVLPAEEADVELDVVDVAADRLDAELSAAARYAFDLSGHLPLRARLLRAGAHDHVLLLLLHHAVGDDWSLAPLADDLADAYAARLDGAAPTRPPLPVQYPDYALWQRELLAEDAELTRRQLDFWAERLAGLPEQLDLPTDRRRPAVASHRGAVVPVRVDAALHRELRALARRHGATVFMTLQAGLAALLTRLGAGTDIPLGTPVAGRADRALDDLVGFFANTLVLRTDTSGDPGFATLLERVRESDLAAFDHHDLPFERLVEHLRPVRSPARHPLFQVMLSYGAARPAPRLPGLAASPVRVHNGSAKFDLTFSLGDTPDGDGIEGFLEYAVDLFDADSARALADRLVRLLRQAVAAPAEPIGRLELLSEPERRRVVEEWNDTAAPVDPRSFPEMFEDQVRAHPDREALIAGPHRLTYRQLNGLANRLAHRLIALGVGAERTVGVHLPRGAEMVVGLLAVQKAAGAFVPLEPTWPAPRIAGIVAGAAPTVVLTTPGGADALPDDVTTVELDLCADWFGDQPDHDPGVPIDPEGLSYVIYTSGSTGTPKGAMIRHRAISNRLPWQIGLLGLTPDDPVLHKAPLTFDISVNEIFLPLAAGAPLVVADAGREGDVAHLLDLIARERIAFVYLVSSILDIMLERDDVAAAAGSLQHVWCGGEVLTPELFRRFRSRMPGATMYHGYGPAEATIGVTCQVYRGDADGGITIGRPNPNTRVHVLDPAMNPVPVGVPGELYLGGIPLGRGYLGDPVRTAAAFVPDPFSGEPGARLYRSGDLARYRADGHIEFLGRVDNQVKVRGIRVELEEIESVLSGHPGVRQAVVLVRRGVPGGEHLVAWCVPDPAHPAADGDALLEWLRGRLPEYMVPRRCHIVPAFPLMTSGKVDRKALAARDEQQPAPRDRSGHVAPAQGTQRLVADAWEQALGIEGVGAHDNFFDLGGHSLLLARVQTLLRGRLGWDVPVLDLFTRPTVAALADHLDSHDGRAPASASAPGAREALGVLLPLRTEGSKAPLFCVHPASGLSWPFAGLRQHIDADRPLYGLQSRALGGELPVPGTLEEMAAEYVEHVRRVRPHGPYHLVGWSFGGVVAHTMATQLREAGERVGLLGMLDSYPRYPWEKLADDHEQQALRSLLYMSHYDLSQLDGTPLTRDRVMAVIAERGGVLSELSPSAIQGVMDTFVSSTVLQQGLDHRVFDGDVVFFTATVNQVDPMLSYRDWKPYVDGTIENHNVACEHKDMTRNGPLAEIGRHLDRRLGDLDDRLGDLDH
ncbi:amino acid adenylation domain-containing protein [Streptomyces sp. PTM05]|uniref:Amino acid adenylation domain-containing protein n=1 Tax=Streptantibioticus parmotrematis TaxID=2873249 RepID=A0ABS7QJL2_9ACTN|nr:non-ribosomal peptide synthetase [Streptantibioticus parmotrematis]MBY8883356.1 amino acid adenylation domain-containing protein [Streptantibioticus parmotrematis]